MRRSGRTSWTSGSARLAGRLWRATQGLELVRPILRADGDDTIARLADQPGPRAIDPSSTSLHRQHEHPRLGLEPEIAKGLAFRRRPRLHDGLRAGLLGLLQG